MATKKKRSTGKASAKRAVSPAKQLKKVRSDLAKAKRPIYALNRKIKNAPSKYYERKYKKQKKEFLSRQESEISKLISERDSLSSKLKRYNKAKEEKSKEYKKVYNLERDIEKAVDNKDYKKAEELRYRLLKHLGAIDRLREEMGVKLDKTNKEDIDIETEDGGKGYVIDGKSPYAIWEAIKQLHADLDRGFFKFYIINGKRFSSDSPIQITSEASAFWIASKKNQDGTPYINRYVNMQTKSVKYLHFKS